MFCRNQTSRATVARGSAMEMEVKRGRFRLSVLEDSAQDCEVQRRIEREVRIREGACKLLAACSQRDQALEASKTLLTSNSRILALMTQLQRMKEAQAMLRAGRRSSDGESVDKRLPCTGKVAISDIRIPLMWKDSEYFKNKGELHRCAVFCLLQVGTEIHDTDLVIVDRTLTDICFNEPVIFTDVPPGFDLRVELYSCCVEEEFSMGFSTRRLSRLGSASSKKFMATLETAASCSSHSSGTGSPGVESPVLLPALSLNPVRIWVDGCHENSTSEDTHNWMEAFWQHFYDMSQWKQCCNELMKIEEPSPKKMMVTLTQGSLYHEMGKSIQGLLEGYYSKTKTCYLK
uniref:Rhotekin-like n=1 Tax=Sinocyclocheilus grahami TaxID=75366 RepID=A0A672MKW5_SINGR